MNNKCEIAKENAAVAPIRVSNRLQIKKGSKQTIGTVIRPVASRKQGAVPLPHKPETPPIIKAASPPRKSASSVVGPVANIDNRRKRNKGKRGITEYYVDCNLCPDWLVVDLESCIKSTLWSILEETFLKNVFMNPKMKKKLAKPRISNINRKLHIRTKVYFPKRTVKEIILRFLKDLGLKRQVHVRSCDVMSYRVE